MIHPIQYVSSALVRTLAPGGADLERWGKWLRGEAARWPYSSESQAHATGYLELQQSSDGNDLTDSLGKTTLAALKIVATIASGEPLFILPLRALSVGQVNAI